MHWDKTPDAEWAVRGVARGALGEHARRVAQGVSQGSGPREMTESTSSPGLFMWFSDCEVYSCGLVTGARDVGV